MTLFFFATDLHGSLYRYERLFERILTERPSAVLLGGDLLPGGNWYSGAETGQDFIRDFLVGRFAGLARELGSTRPKVLLIPGNDDPGAQGEILRTSGRRGRWTYLHGRSARVGEWTVYGYACVPPTPFALKDWERYDVSRYVDPGCVSPEEGYRSVPVEEWEIRTRTMAQDLEDLAGSAPMEKAIFLFHAPPYRTDLDRAALDGRMVEGVPLDPNVGSIAIRRFIQARQPLITLHGHVHESARLTGQWLCRLGRTVAISGAHDGPELALVRFYPERPDAAERELI
jgi:uncharacterized protein